MLWKQKIRIISIWILLLSVTAVVVYKLPAIYRSEALVLVDSQKIPDKYVTSTVNTDVGDRLATIGQQIMTTERMLKIINTYNLYPNERKTKPQEEVIEQMRKDISLQVEKGWTGGRPGAFRIGYEGKNPMLVAEIANQIANLYVDENLKTREVQAEGTSDFIESQLGEAKRNLDELEAKVSAFKSQHNGELPEQESSLLGTISNLQIQLQGNQDAINREQQNKIALETALATVRMTEQLLATPPPVPAPGSSAAIAPPKTRLELLQEQMDRLKVDYGPNYPELKLLQGEIDRVKKQEQAPQDGAVKKPSSEPQTAAEAPSLQGTRPMSKELLGARERIANLETQVSLANHDIDYLTNEHQKILKAISVYQARVDRLPAMEQGMAAMTRDYEISKANYRSLLDKKISAGMAADMERRQESERFEVIDRARVPEVPIKPNRPLLAGVGTVLSLAVGLLFGFAIEIRKSALLGEWEIPADIPVLGRVPFIVMEVIPSPSRRRRMPVIAASVFICLVAIGVGVYWFWGRA
jgi:polysaccharide chain length determinant protein (PEP-CTERM system associated)